MSAKPAPTEASDFFVELGTEELPAADVATCAEQMVKALEAKLAAAGLEHEGVTVGATPRRTVVRVAKLAAAQESKQERKRGPPQSRAVEEDGETPTKAVLGFCKKNGVEPADLEKDGEYVWADVETVGVSATEVLREALPGVIGGLNFPKTMRWNSEEAFSRPVRWLIAMHGEHHLPFVAAGVASGSTTRLLRNSAAPVAEVTAPRTTPSFSRASASRFPSTRAATRIWKDAVALAQTVNAGSCRPPPASRAGSSTRW